MDKAQAGNLADLMEKISECLDKTVAAIREGRVPHGECAKLQTYSENLPVFLKGLLSEEKALELGDLLLSAYRVEGLAEELMLMPDQALHLVELEKASGKFSASADLLRTGIR